LAGWSGAVFQRASELHNELDGGDYVTSRPAERHELQSGNSAGGFCQANKYRRNYNNEYNKASWKCQVHVVKAKFRVVAWPVCGAELGWKKQNISRRKEVHVSLEEKLLQKNRQNRDCSPSVLVHSRVKDKEHGWMRREMDDWETQVWNKLLKKKDTE
jgi:hypothetical protein